MSIEICREMRAAFATLLIAAAIGAPSQAHQIETALDYLQGDLELRSHFSNGEPATGAVIRLLNQDGSPGPELGRTDENGLLRLDLSDVSDGRHDLQVDGGPGHRDYLEIPVTAGRVRIDEVVQAPMIMAMVGLLVSVRRRRI